MRQWLYDTLSQDPSLIAIFGDRFFQGEGMSTSKVETPYLVYTIGNSTSEDIAEEDAFPERQFFQIYIHDRNGDYGIIDNAVSAVKAVLINKGSAPDNVIMIRYLETSRDLDDQTMGTITRYIRFQAITGR